MTSRTENADTPGGFPAGYLVRAAGLVSCGVIAFEIGLIRVLQYASWYHFAFLVITIALLGFGMSGAILSLWRGYLLRHRHTALPALALLTAVSIPVMLQAAQLLPVTGRFLPGLVVGQLAWWAGYWALLTVPFALGATAIGLALMSAGQRLTAVYASNLIGSASGAVGVTIVMYFVEPAWLGYVTGAVVLAAAYRGDRRAVSTGPVSARVLTVLAVLAVPAGALLALLYPPYIRVDDDKYLAYVNRLEADGQAEQLARAVGPSGVVEAFGSDAFHDMAFMTDERVPPSMASIVVDGHRAGSLLRIDRPVQAEVLDGTLMALPYGLVPSNPRVLLLDEVGGGNVWLARRHGAAAVDVVQPNRVLSDLLAGSLEDEGGMVFDLPGVALHPVESRAFLEGTQDSFDLIQLAGMESWSAAAGGLEGLNQDHLMTVEGMAVALRRLSPDGILHVSRGIQLPPRDNAKIAATVIAALEQSGISRPARSGLASGAAGPAGPGAHIAMVRDFLGVCTMVRPRPWRVGEIRRLRDRAAERNLTPVYFEGITASELNRPDELPGPPGEDGDYLYHVMRNLLSGDPGETARFFDEWPFEVRPATDDRPFFGNFGKLGALPDFRRAYGAGWLLRSELAFLFVLSTAVIVTCAGLVLILLPFVFRSDIRKASGRSNAAVYFLAIGLAYLVLEIAFLSGIQRLLGDPVIGGAATVGGFLLCSGLGSLAANRIAALPGVSLARLALVPAVLAIPVFTGLILLALFGGAWPLGLRLAAVLVFIAPLAFAMGLPFPLGLRWFGARSSALVPWAWGVNGCASVLASPLAMIIAMQWGVVLTVTAAAACYVVATCAAAWSDARR
ncbi:MAG: hypothetical protein F4014_01730 [Gemmatimonadetes bacterium]|nr:hypothetical protein [Gemmatimonadota bacterium]MYK97556.1 hypothetical protein [Gemmatimonadota bacterium]